MMLKELGRILDLYENFEAHNLAEETMNIKKKKKFIEYKMSHKNMVKNKKKKRGKK